MNSAAATLKVAFFDFDGTLASSNVVTRYLYFARSRPSRMESLHRTLIGVGGIPLWLWWDSKSRLLFNRRFYRLYQGISEDWLRDQETAVYKNQIEPTIYPGSRALLERDRAEGYRLVLVTGGLDFAVKRASEELGFDDLIANKMVFSDGVATGRLEEPILAERGKTEAIEDYCRRHGVDRESLKAYSDSYSDLPMLEIATQPAAVNPDAKLRSHAERNGWPVLSTKNA